MQRNKFSYPKRFLEKNYSAAKSNYNKKQIHEK